MFEIEKTFTFEAGHVLKHHDGKCAAPHGHSYRLSILLRGSSLIQTGPKTNMLIDFSDISALVRPMIFEFLDHRWLNDTLQSDSTTVEFIAQWIYNYLKPSLPLLYSVTLFETPNSKTTYTQTT